MFLDYLALVITLVGLTLVFYTFIYIHDIPYEIAKKNNHPHTDAIHIGCVLSLFTLHAMWPILFLWAKISPHSLKVDVTGSAEVLELRKRIETLEQQLNKVTASGTGVSNHA